MFVNYKIDPAAEEKSFWSGLACLDGSQACCLLGELNSFLGFGSYWWSCFGILSCLVLSCLVLSCLVLSCLVLSLSGVVVSRVCVVLCCLFISCLVLSRLA